MNCPDCGTEIVAMPHNQRRCVEILRARLAAVEKERDGANLRLTVALSRLSDAEKLAAAVDRFDDRARARHYPGAHGWQDLSDAFEGMYTALKAFRKA